MICPNTNSSIGPSRPSKTINFLSETNVRNWNGNAPLPSPAITSLIMLGFPRRIWTNNIERAWRLDFDSPIFSRTSHHFFVPEKLETLTRIFNFQFSNSFTFLIFTRLSAPMCVVSRCFLLISDIFYLDWSHICSRDSNSTRWNSFHNHRNYSRVQVYTSNQIAEDFLIIFLSLGSHFVCW